MKLGTRYDLFQGGKWKLLVQTYARALDGKCEDEWEKQVDALGNYGGLHQKKKMRTMFQKMNAKILGKDAANKQKKAMRNGELAYEGHDHAAMAERLFRINEDIDLFSEKAKPFDIDELIRDAIEPTLKSSARLMFVEKSGRE